MNRQDHGVSFGWAAVFAICVTAVLGAHMAVAAEAVKSPPFPAYAPLPAGFSVQPRNGYVAAYGREEFNFPVPGQSSSHVIVEGPAWRILVRSEDKPPLSAEEVFNRFRELLEKEGWTYVTRSPIYVFKRVADGKESWLQIDGPNSSGIWLRLAERGGSPRTLTLPQPGEKAEPWNAGEIPSYILPYPGARLVKSSIRIKDSFEVTVSADEERQWVGNPLLELQFEHPADLSPFEFTKVFVGALEQAGWKIIRKTGGPGSTGDMDFLAHYTSAGRDIWMYGHDAQQYDLKLADLGVQAQPGKLKEVLDREGRVALYGIYFDIDKATIKPESEATLNQILSLLRDNPKLTLRVEGHTDNTGPRPHNQTLSEARAASVKAWLVDHGIDSVRLVPEGFADTKPVADNATPEGRSKNRRVELAKP